MTPEQVAYEYYGKEELLLLIPEWHAQDVMDHFDDLMSAWPQITSTPTITPTISSFTISYPDIRDFGMPEEDQTEKTGAAPADNIVSIDAVQDSEEALEKGA